jgi:Uma2 family endonuclease
VFGRKYAMSSTTATATPPLVHGERLSRDEFERRYEAVPDVRAELIDGVVHMASPVSFDHSSPLFDVVGWLGFYRAHTPGVLGADNGTLRLNPTGEPQPDGMLFISEECGGLIHLSADHYPEGSPELVLEVAVSSVAYDVNVKLPFYLRGGVREYLIWRVEDEAIDWYVLRNGRYELLRPDANGIVRSEHLPGLWLDRAAMARRDMATVFSALMRGVGSPEHTQFVQLLQQRKQAGSSGGTAP